MKPVLPLTWETKFLEETLFLVDVITFYYKWSFTKRSPALRNDIFMVDEAVFMAASTVFIETRCTALIKSSIKQNLYAVVTAI